MRSSLWFKSFATLFSAALVHSQFVVNNVPDVIGQCEPQQFTWQDSSSLSTDDFIMTGYSDTLISTLIVTIGSGNGSFVSKVPYPSGSTFQYGASRGDLSSSRLSQNYTVQKGEDSTCLLAYTQIGEPADASSSALVFTQVNQQTAACTSTAVAWSGGTPPFIVSFTAANTNDTALVSWAIRNVTTRSVQIKVPFDQGSTYNITLQDAKFPERLVSQPVSVSSSASVDCLLPFQPWSDPYQIVAVAAGTGTNSKTNTAIIIGGVLGGVGLLLLCIFAAGLAIRHRRRISGAAKPIRLTSKDGSELSKTICHANELNHHSKLVPMQNTDSFEKVVQRPALVYGNGSTDALSDCDPATLSFVMDISREAGPISEAKVAYHPRQPLGVLFTSTTSLPEIRKDDGLESKDSLDHATVLNQGARSLASTPTTDGPVRKPSVARKPPPRLSEADLLLAKASTAPTISSAPPNATSFSLTPDPVTVRASMSVIPPLNAIKAMKGR